MENNELKINRLLEYKFIFSQYGFDGDKQQTDIVCTGDALDFDVNMAGGTFIVMRAGNPVRYIIQRPDEIIVTPVEA